MLIKLQNGSVIEYNGNGIITEERKYSYNKDKIHFDYNGDSIYPIEDMVNDYDYEHDYSRMNVHAERVEQDNFYNDELKVYLTYPDIKLGENEHTNYTQESKETFSSNGISFGITQPKKIINNITTTSTFGRTNNKTSGAVSRESHVEYKKVLIFKLTNKNIPTYCWDDLVKDIKTELIKQYTKNKTMLDTLSQVNFDINKLEEITNKKLELSMYEFNVSNFLDDEIKYYRDEYCPICGRYKQDVFCLHFNDELDVNTEEELKDIVLDVMKLDSSGTGKDTGFDEDDVKEWNLKLKKLRTELEQLRKLYK